MNLYFSGKNVQIREVIMKVHVLQDLESVVLVSTVFFMKVSFEILSKNSKNLKMQFLTHFQSQLVVDLQVLKIVPIL